MENTETQEFLEKLKLSIDYNPDTGKFYWKIDKVNRKAGDIAGNLSPNGRILIGFNGKLHKAHRLAWLISYGKYPENMIDHIDGNPANNRLSNLRDVTKSINMQNIRSAGKNNTSGFLGVCFDKKYKKFIASIKVNGKTKHLGRFFSAEDAHQAYLNAKRKLHEGCTI